MKQAKPSFQGQLDAGLGAQLRARYERLWTLIEQAIEAKIPLLLQPADPGLPESAARGHSDSGVDRASTAIRLLESAVRSLARAQDCRTKLLTLCPPEESEILAETPQTVPAGVPAHADHQTASEPPSAVSSSNQPLVPTPDPPEPSVFPDPLRSCPQPSKPATSEDFMHRIPITSSPSPEGTNLNSRRCQPTDQASPVPPTPTGVEQKVRISDCSTDPIIMTKHGIASNIQANVSTKTHNIREQSQNKLLAPQPHRAPAARSDRSPVTKPRPAFAQSPPRPIRGVDSKPALPQLFGLGGSYAQLRELVAVPL